MTSITYLDHSGFAVAIDAHLLVFDYYNDRGEERSIGAGVIDPEELRRYQRVSVFVSHGHSDHFNPVIFSWKDATALEYILSSDIGDSYPGERMGPGEALTLGDMVVRAYGSTDLGVSFLVEKEGLRIFHAGDLNWWHWREESSAMEIAQSEEDFKREMEPIEKEAKRSPIDIAFFPLDPRQKVFYDAGANYFYHSVKPAVMIPMHFMGQGDLVQDYAKRTHIRNCKVAALTRRGEQLIYKKEEEKP